jgi:hypothetical protein
MKSVKRFANKRTHKLDYYQLAVLIFGDDEAVRNYSEDAPISERRRKLIDRFVPTDWVERLLKARARTVAARKKVDQMMRGELHPSPPTIPQSADPIWAISEEELKEISATDVQPRYVLDAYARATINEGRIEGQIWALVIQAHDRWKPKVGKKRGNYSKVAVAEAQMTVLLKDYFRRSPGHITLTDDAIRKRIEGDWDAQFSNGFGGSASTVHRLVGTVRNKHPEMRRPKATSRRQT